MQLLDPGSRQALKSLIRQRHQSKDSISDQAEQKQRFCQKNKQLAFVCLDALCTLFKRSQNKAVHQDAFDRKVHLHSNRPNLNALCWSLPVSNCAGDAAAAAAHLPFTSSGFKAGILKSMLKINA